MFEASDKVEPVFPAATVVLLRDAEQSLETLLVQRSRAVKHMGGMWVFPGGKVDEEDYPEGHNEYAAAINAAIRETREEAGLTITAEQLVYLSHWTTPEGAKKRFATWFFLAILEEGQEVEVDGGEIANHRWITPQQAIAESVDDEHELRLMPPTFVSLSDIAGYDSCEAARAGIGSRDAIIYEPHMVFVEDGICFLYAGDVAYDDEDEDLEADGPRHRCYMIDGKLDYDRTELPWEP